MHDIRTIRDAPQQFDAAMGRRGVKGAAERLLRFDRSRREGEARLQETQARRNALSREIAEAKRRGADTAALEADGTAIRAEIEALARGTQQDTDALRAMLETLPNILDADVPDGPDERSNVVLKQVGEPHTFDFRPREHDELGEALGLMDFARAAKIAGSRFVILRGALARLERALGAFMIDLHTRAHGYEELSVPLLVGDAAVYGTNQLPKFAADLFHTTDGRWLIPTAEVPLTNTVAGEIIAEAELPMRLAALTDCFRSEAGAAGRDTRGMLRQHQFKKVELVSITRPQDSDGEHERMTQCAETVLERLEIPYRRVLLCSGDTGFGSARTHDLEVWLPGQGAWREISSCSNMRAFQARRMNARYRLADGKTLQHVHTLNGSGVAVGRALIAVMENYQQENGSIAIPSVLRPLMGGAERIEAGLG